MELDTLKKLYIDELKDLYSAENQILKALPRMAKAASSPELKQAFQTHLAETEAHVERLERVFESLEASPRGKKCVGMEGLIEEAKELIQEDPEPEVLDAGLISKAQHVEHYEIAGYGTVRAYALQLGEEQQAALLQETLDEEGATDKLLTGLAESAINLEAARAGEGAETIADAGQSRGGSSKRPAKRTEREVTRVAASERGAGAQQTSRSGKSSRSKRSESEAQRR
jgi:ferritin-like metal-binding protein YciE